jgi:hypothetical protein
MKMIQKLVVTLVVIAATNSKCIQFGDVECSELKEAINEAITQHKDPSNQHKGKFSLHSVYPDFEFLTFKKADEIFGVFRESLDIVNSVPNEKVSTDTHLKEEPNFLDYFSKDNISYEKNDYTVMKLIRLHALLERKNYEKVTFKETQLLKMFRLMMNSVLLLHERDISFLHFGKHSFAFEKEDINSRIKLKLFGIAKVSHDEIRVKELLNLATNILRLKTKEASHGTRDLLFQNDLWMMITFLHRLVTGDFSLISIVNSLEKQFQKLLIKYEDNNNCRTKIAEEREKDRERIVEQSKQLNIRNYSNSFEGFANMSSQMLHYIHPGNFDNVNPRDSEIIKTELFEKLTNCFNAIDAIKRNSLSSNSMIKEENGVHENKEKLLDENKEKLDKELDELIEEYKKIEAKVADPNWIIANKVNYETRNGEISLEKIVKEMLKTGKNTKTAREIIVMLDSLIGYLEYEKMIEENEVKIEKEDDYEEEEEKLNPNKEVKSADLNKTKGIKKLPKTKEDKNLI